MIELDVVRLVDNARRYPRSHAARRSWRTPAKASSERPESAYLET